MSARGRRPREFILNLGAGVPRALDARGRFFGIIDAPDAPLDVEIDGDGVTLRRGPGGSVLVSDEFSQIRLTSAIAQAVRLVVADEPQDVSNIISASGSAGTVSSVEAPSSTVATPDDNAIGAGATENIAANPARRRITIGVPSDAADPIRVQAVGANNASGVEIVPGTSYRFDTIASLDIHCEGATGSEYWIFEESGP